MTDGLVRGSCAYLEVVVSIEGGAIATGTYLLRAQCYQVWVLLVGGYSPAA